MSTREIDNPDELDVDDAPDPDAEKKANRQLRDHLKKVERENADLRLKVMGSYLGEIGLRETDGLGKAIAKEYTGDLNVEAIAEYAKAEYGHEAEVTAAPAAVTAADRVATLQQNSSPVPAAPTMTPSEEAALKMHDPEATRQDAVASLTGKVIDFAQEHYGPTGPQGPSR